MLFDMLKPRLSLMLCSLGISLAVNLIRTWTVNISQLLSMALVVYSTLDVLKNYAPKVYNHAISGIGTITGLQMVLKKN